MPDICATQCFANNGLQYSHLQAVSTRNHIKRLIQLQYDRRQALSSFSIMYSVLFVGNSTLSTSSSLFTPQTTTAFTQNTHRTLKKKFLTHAQHPFRCRNCTFPHVSYAVWLYYRWQWQSRGRYHGGLTPSSDDGLHTSTVIPPSALHKLSIMKHYHHRWTTRWGMTACSPTMATLHYTRFVEYRWWNDGWTVVSLHGTGPRRTDNRPGKFLQRVRSVSPTGDMASTMCRLFAHLFTKNCQMLSRACGAPAAMASLRIWADTKHGLILSWSLHVHSHSWKSMSKKEQQSKMLVISTP